MHVVHCCTGWGWLVQDGKILKGGDLIDAHKDSSAFNATFAKTATTTLLLCRSVMNLALLVFNVHTMSLCMIHFEHVVLHGQTNTI